MFRVIERLLYRWGYFVPEVRRMVAAQMVIALLAVGLLPFGSWGIGFCAGVVLATINFLALAKVIQELVFVRRGAVAALLMGFYVRLLLTAAALYVLIVSWQVSVVMLLAGVSTVVLNILLWGIVHCVGRTSKEA